MTDSSLGSTQPTAPVGSSSSPPLTYTSSTKTEQEALLDKFCEMFLAEMYTRGFKFPALEKGLETTKRKLFEVNC